MSNGTTITRAKAPSADLAGDNPHSNAAAVTDYDGGKMDGFDKGTPDQPTRPYFYYAESQIPNYWKYARTFALFDNFFSTTAGPTSPGHFAIATGQAPFLDNPYCTDGTDDVHAGLHRARSPLSKVDPLDLKTCKSTAGPSCVDVPTVLDVLPAGVTWRAYGTGTQPNINSPFSLVKKVGGDAAVRAAHFRDNTHLFTDLANDDLANYMQIDVYSRDRTKRASIRPQYPCGGENYTVQHRQRPHEEPALERDGHRHHLGRLRRLVRQRQAAGADVRHRGEFVNTGFRLPAIVISPYARQAVVHTKTEQVSVTRLVEDLLGGRRVSSLDPNARDGKAGSMLGAFDFTQAPTRPARPHPAHLPLMLDQIRRARAA